MGGVFTLDNYRSYLRRVLALPSLPVEAAASPAVRLVLMPSFYPEGAITLVAAPDTARLIVRNLDRSAWKRFNATGGGDAMDPLGGSDALMVIAEEIAVEGGLARTLVARVVAAASGPARETSGHDGVFIEGEVADGGRILPLSSWSPTRAGDALEQAILDVLELAGDRLPWSIHPRS